MKKHFSAVFSLMLLTVPAFAKDYVIASGTVFGCTKKDDVVELIGYMVDRDMPAFKIALTEKYETGLCTVFEKGDKVLLVEATLSGLTKIRKQGQTKAFWVDSSQVN